MKLLLLSSLLLTYAFPGIWAACSIGIGVPTSNSIVITLSPSPKVVIDGLGPDLSATDIISRLNNSAHANQIIALIKTSNPDAIADYFWITNEIFVKNVITTAIAQVLCNLFTKIVAVSVPEVLPAPAPIVVNPEDVSGTQASSCANVTNGVPWGITTINAPQANALNYRGQGIVVASIDTGVRCTHVELAGKMRAAYSWYDPYNVSPTTCSDSTGHGTHTMATMVGNTVGVAPMATYITCRGCVEDGCTEQNLKACFQWLACPDNTALNCTTRPNIISNSWGSSSTTKTAYDSVLAVWASLNIASFFSAGNTGNNCSSAGSPGNSNWTKYKFLDVGATACDETIAYFSGFGPSKSPSNLNGLAPQISAPGLFVYSASYSSDTGYVIKSGTSMAAPHVSGAAAVVLSKNPGLTPTQLDNVLTSTAWKNPSITSSSQYCGSGGLGSGGGYPNNVFGYGRVDVLAAVNSIIAG